MADENDFVDRYSLAIDDLTRITDPARKFVMFAPECITGPIIPYICTQAFLN